MRKLKSRDDGNGVFKGIQIFKMYGVRVDFENWKKKLRNLIEGIKYKNDVIF